MPRQIKMRPYPTHTLRRDSRRGGFTIVEAVVVMAILLMGLLAMTSTSVTVHSLRDADRDRRTANLAMQSVIEDVKRVSAVNVGSDPSWARNFTNAYLAGGIPGPNLLLQGLDLQQGAAQNCTITVITDETLTDQELGVELGMPRDLDNDGVIDNSDVSASATLLPVIVQIDWTGSAGDRSMSQGFYVLGF